MKATDPSPSQAFPGRGDDDANARAEVGRGAWQILLPLIIVAGLIALWLATAPSSGTVIMSGQVKVEPSWRIAQHQDGAIAREILVRGEPWGRAGQSDVLAERARSEPDLRLLPYEARAAGILVR